MFAPRKVRRTILHFGTDRVVLHSRARSLRQMGYRVLNASDGFEAIKLSALEKVDAVVLDLDRNHAEVDLVAREIKRCRPRVPTILLAEETAQRNLAHTLADAMVLRNNVNMLVTALEAVLAADVGTTTKAS